MELLNGKHLLEIEALKKFLSSVKSNCAATCQSHCEANRMATIRVEDDHC